MTLRFTLLTIILFITSIAQAQYIKNFDVNQINNSYIPSIELEKLKTLYDQPPYYTTVLIASSGYYEIVKVNEQSNWKHTYDTIHFGRDMETATATFYEHISTRYHDNPPDNPDDEERIGDIQFIQASSTINPTLQSPTVSPSLDIESCGLHVDTNHHILGDQINLFAISHTPVKDGHIYFFYNRGLTESKPEAVTNFSKAAKQPLQAHYVNTDSIKWLKVDKFFNDSHGANFTKMGFGNVLKYSISPQEISTRPDEMRLFLNLANAGVFPHDSFDVLAVFTSNADIDPCSLSDKEKNLLNGTDNINGEAIISAEYVKQKVRPPHDPNRLDLLSSCYCGPKKPKKNPHNYSFSFLFCNNTTGTKKLPANPALSATIDFTYNTKDFTCVRPAGESTQRDITITGNQWYMELDTLLDFRVELDTSKCCDRFYFDAVASKRVEPKHLTNKIKVCVTFNGNTQSVCDSTLYISDFVDPKLNQPCQSTFLTFCDSTRHECKKSIWQRWFGWLWA